MPKKKKTALTFKKGIVSISQKEEDEIIQEIVVLMEEYYDGIFHIPYSQHHEDKKES